jgi:hypothetical protein
MLSWVLDSTDITEEKIGFSDAGVAGNNNFARKIELARHHRVAVYCPYILDWALKGMRASPHLASFEPW